MVFGKTDWQGKFLCYAEKDIAKLVIVMNLLVIGTGYVGLVSGVMLASLGMRVTCLDKDKTKIASLKNGEIPIYEPGLEKEVISAISRGNLSFANDYSDIKDPPDAVFITVGTPPLDSGDADLSYVFDASLEAAKNIPYDSLIIIKSTVPPGTTNLVAQKIEEAGYEHKVASNPEFLREGKAIYDFMNPDRIVVGINDDISKQIIAKIYSHFKSFVWTDPTTAELIKYASNSFLATKIAFINELSNICEKTGGDIDALSYGMGLDKRIGPDFLKVSPGFGGSCFPKDILALEHLAQKYNEPFYVLSAVIEANKKRVVNIVDKISTKIGSLQGKKIAILGLTFKADTDDIRSSPAIDIVKILINKGAIISAYDPAGMANAKDLGLNVDFADSVTSAAFGVDAILILTEWSEFKDLDYALLSTKMGSKIIFDYRNILDIEHVKKEGFTIYQLGKNDV